MPEPPNQPPADKPKITDNVLRILSPASGDIVPVVFNVVGSYEGPDGVVVTVSIVGTSDSATAVVASKAWVAAFDPAGTNPSATIYATAAGGSDTVPNVTIAEDPPVEIEQTD